MSKLIPVIFTLLLTFTSCQQDAGHTFDNPVDPESSKSPIGEVAQTETASGGNEAATEAQPAATTPPEPCLTADCVTPTTPSLVVNYLAFIADTCEAANVTVLKNTSLNRITLIYRAKYASDGLWQLYVRNLTVNPDGTLALTGTGPTNLFPNQCIGNTTGVTGYTISGYAGTGTTYKYYDWHEVTNASAFAINMTCYSAPLNLSNTFDAATLSPSVATTTSFLTTDGAVGYYKVQNVYVKSNGTTINLNGTANAFVIPGNWTSSGTSPLGPIQGIYGNDAAGGLYISSKNGSTSHHKYLTAGGVLTDMTSTVDFGYIIFPPLNTRASGGIFHSTLGMYAANTYYSYIYGFNNGTSTSKSTDAIGTEGHVLGFAADKLLTIGEAVYFSDGWNRSVQSFNFSSGTFSTLAAQAFPPGSSSYSYDTLGLYNAKALFYDGKCRIYLTGDFFQ